MGQVLVTGANKGIGYGIAKGILADHGDTFVFLGARDTKRGTAAVERLTAEDSSFEGRVRFVRVDVASDESGGPKPRCLVVVSESLLSPRVAIALQ